MDVTARGAATYRTASLRHGVSPNRIIARMSRPLTGGQRPGMTDRVFRIPVPDRRLDNDQTSFNEKFGNMPSNHHQAAVRSASRVLGVTNANAPCRAAALGHDVAGRGSGPRGSRATTCHASELGPREAGCPVRPPAHAALGREGTVDVLLPPKSRCHPVRTTAEATCGARSAGRVR